MTDIDSTDALDPGVARAGAATAARRRELDISQRSLAAGGVINASALIAFEKGRSWPRERTRARLENVLGWPPGAILRLRRVGSVTGGPPAASSANGGEAPLIAQAVVAAVGALGAAVDSLPSVDDPDFTPKLTAILADLRQLESVAAQATRISKVTPALIRALGTVRGRRDELTILGASAPGATLGQRLYAARRRANLTIAETAQVAEVSEDAIVGIEADQPQSADVARAVETVINDLTWT